MTERPSCAVGVPNGGPFGDPRLLVDMAVAAEEAGWDGFFLWDHLLWIDPDGHVADPTVVISAVAARTERIRIGIMVNLLARRRAAKVAGPMVPAAGCAQRARWSPPSAERSGPRWLRHWPPRRSPHGSLAISLRRGPLPKMPP